MNVFLLKSIAWILIIDFAIGAPEIVESPVDKQVLEGGNITLRCVVNGIPSDDRNPVQWMKNNFGLGNLDSDVWERYSMVGDVSSGEYHLRIINADVAVDDYMYECQVTRYGLRSESAKLTVLVPPSGPFIDDVEDYEDVAKVNAVVDKENELTCNAINGKPAATLLWFKNDQEIYEGIESVISSPLFKLYNVSSTLRFTPTANDVDSTYTCVMSSEALSSSQEKRKTIKLNLLEPPKVSIHFPDKIIEGDYLEIQCRSYADPPVIAYRWYLNEVLQPEETTSTFNFGLVNRTWDGATVGCEAKNAAGYSKKNVRKISVLYAPVFLGGTDKIVADIGQNVTLRCQWDSNPRSTITWVREDTDVAIGWSSALHLANVDQSDGGKYHCCAQADEVGKNQATTELVVHGPPIFNHEKSQYAILGDNAGISCSLKSSPGIQHVTWSWDVADYKIILRDNGTRQGDDGKIKYRSVFEPGANLARLMVTKATTEDLRTYKCSIGNSYGDRTTEIVLKEDSSKAAHIFTLSASIGIAAGIAVFIITLLVIVWCCIRSRREQKTTNFDKMSKINTTSEGKEKMYKQDEAIAIHHGNDVKSGSYNVPSSSVSSHGGEGSSVSAPDEVKPTSGQDDGYHTEVANSWYPTKESQDEVDAAPIKKTGYLHAPYVELPPNADIMDHNQPLLSDQFLGSDHYLDYPPRPMSANRYPYEQSGLPPPSTFRSASALGRFSPYDRRMYPDVATPYAHPQSDFYTVNSVHPTLQPIMEPVFGNSPYVGRPRLTPVPQTMLGTDRYQQASSQSSLDKFERESALSNSIIPTRIDAMDHPGRNLSSRLSQSSKSSEFNRPLVARMATHV